MRQQGQSPAELAMQPQPGLLLHFRTELLPQTGPKLVLVVNLQETVLAQALGFELEFCTGKIGISTPDGVR